MRRYLRKLRAVVGIGATWGILWAAIGTAIALVIGVVDPDSIDPGESALVIAAIFGLIGFISGAGFATLLSFAESRKRILDLSLIRVALWGILGSAAFPLLAGKYDQLLIFCPLGAVFSAASVAIVRRLDRRDLEQEDLLISAPLPDVMATAARERRFPNPARGL